MNTNHLLSGHRQQTQRVVIEQIMPGSEGKPTKIIHASYRRRFDIPFIQRFPIERHPLIHSLDCCPQTLELQRTPLLHRHIVSLGNFFVPCHKKSFLPCFPVKLQSALPDTSPLRERRPTTSLLARLGVASSRVKLELLTSIHEVLCGLLRANSCGLCSLIETLLSNIARVAMVILRQGAPTSHAHS